MIEYSKWAETAYNDIEFIKTGTSAALLKAFQYLDSAKMALSDFKNEWIKKHPDYELEINQMIGMLDSSGTLSREIANLTQKKGFKNFGLEGEMRELIHRLEKNPLNPDPVLLLTLRRHEKDFLLRKDLEYVNKFDATLATYIESINTKVLNDSEKELLISWLKEYEQIFKKIVKIEETIGFFSNVGLRGDIQHLHNKYTSRLEKINQLINLKIKQLNKHSSWIIYILLFMFILLTIGVSAGFYYYFKYVSGPIELLETIASKIAQGKMSVELDEESVSIIIKNVVIAFKQIVLKIQHTVSTIEKIINREQTTELTLASQEDEVGMVLNKIILKLNEIDEKEKRRSWETTGLNKFLEIMRLHDEPSKLADAVLPELTRYVNAQVSALFVVVKNRNDKEVLHMISCYAYERKKYLQKEIMPGEGLVGQVFLERESIFLTEIPPDFIRIRSGTGDCIPRSAIIAPLKHNDKIVGVLEIASMDIFAPYHLVFIDKVCSALASTLISLELRAKAENHVYES
jgi:hypothetical protein